MDALSANILTDELNEAQSCVTCEEICTGYSDGGCLDRLRTAGLRPTRQRLMLGELLFLKGDRHVTAEMLYAEAVQANIQLSLATVYNTLNQFTQAGLLRRIGPDGSKSFFDTNTSVHPHFYLEGEDILVDIPDTLALEHMPEALPGHEISRLDIIIHIRRKPRDADI
ncbi:Fur family transcriptional regulator Irr [Bradyrhizobium cenepequi]